MLDAGIQTNALLAGLEPSVRTKFKPRFQVVKLDRGEVLHAPSEPVDRVYFPLTGLVGVLSETRAGEVVQTGMIGCDGAIGAIEARAHGRALSKALVQIPGNGLRLSAAAYGDLIEASAALRAGMQRHMQTQLADARQSVVCNALHPVEKRLSRAILEALERSCLEDGLPLTQETLAQMLGSQRTTVAVFLSRMQRAGLIKCRRGLIEVQNHERLERMACACRASLKVAREDLERTTSQAPVMPWRSNRGLSWDLEHPGPGAGANDESADEGSQASRMER